MFNVIENPIWIGWSVVLLGAALLPVSGEAATGSSDLDVLLETLATGSDEAASVALLQLDAESALFLQRYEQVADAVLKATGSLDKNELADFIEGRNYFRTPFDKLSLGKKVGRKDVLVFWMAERIRTAPHGERKEEILNVTVQRANKAPLLGGAGGGLILTRAR